MDIPSEVFDKLAENGIEKHDVRKRPYDPKRAKAQDGDAGTAGRAYTSADNRNNAGGKTGHMQFIEDLREGDSIHSIYLCKKKQELKTKAGKAYDSLTLQDKTGTLDAKIWNPGDMGIGDFDNLDYLPVSERSIDEMWTEFSNYIGKIEEPHMKALLESFFVDDPDFIQTFKNSSAAKTMHHGYVGGLLEHSLNVTKLCYAYCRLYPTLKRDLLVPAAMLHDIGKTRELSPFPRNDYTDEGQLLGHIVIGCMMIDEKIKGIDGFPVVLKEELEHCILAHHGKLEFGSPKVPALMEAAALNFADNTDAHLEMFKEILAGSNLDAWAGYQSKVESNVRRTDLE